MKPSEDTSKLTNPALFSALSFTQCFWPFVSETLANTNEVVVEGVTSMNVLPVT